MAYPFCSVQGMTTNQPPTSENRPLTIRAAADYCGVSVETMRARVNDGTIPAARLGTAIRIRPADLDALFVASPTQGGRQ